MVTLIFSLRDSKANAYGTPFFQRSLAEAERMCAATVRDKQTTPGQFPEDFDLYFVGSYDDQTGKIEVLDSPQHKLKLIDLVQTL